MIDSGQYPRKCSPDGVFREYKYTREIAAAVIHISSTEASTQPWSRRKNTTSPSVARSIESSGSIISSIRSLATLAIQTS